VVGQAPRAASALGGLSQVAVDGDQSELSTTVGSLLAAARRTVKLRQVEVVERTNLSQAQLSRIERGSAMPTVEQARELANLYRLQPAARSRLTQAARDHEAGRSDSRLVIQRGNVLSLQQRFRRIEEAATVTRGFSPSMVLGELQTPAYIAAVFDQPEDAEVVRDRLRRAVEAPSNRGRIYTAILAEGAVRWPLGSASIMADQVEHLIQVSDLPNVRLGFIGWQRPVDVGPGPGFNLYDDHTVVLNGVGGYALLNSPTDIATYRASFEHLERLAVFDEDARRQLSVIAADYRRVAEDA
jgi:transcriptional regulator with XRE-family HTH domain